MIQAKKNVLISLEGRHANNIIKKKKKVELRKRRMNLSKGDFIWIYSKLPDGCIVARATVKAVYEKSPQFLWDDFQEDCGISKKEFFAYFNGVDVGYAVSLSNVIRLHSPPTLEKICKKYKTFYPPQLFYPPQFSKYLDGAPLLSFLEHCLTKA